VLAKLFVFFFGIVFRIPKSTSINSAFDTLDLQVRLQYKYGTFQHEFGARRQLEFDRVVALMLSTAFYPGYVDFVIKTGTNCPYKPPYRAAEKSTQA
jgi:hypothetical protein